MHTAFIPTEHYKREKDIGKVTVRQKDKPAQLLNGDHEIIARLVRGVLEVFSLLLHALRKSDSWPRKVDSILRRSHSTLKLWADGHDAQEGGLDVVLAKSKSLQYTTLATLNSLGEALFNRLTKIVLKSLDEGEKSSFLRKIEANRDTFEKAKRNLAAMDESGDQTSCNFESSCDESDAEEIDSVLEEVKTYTQCLVDLNNALECPAIDPDDEEKPVHLTVESQYSNVNEKPEYDVSASTSGSNNLLFVTANKPSDFKTRHSMAKVRTKAMISYLEKEMKRDIGGKSQQSRLWDHESLAPQTRPGKTSTEAEKAEKLVETRSIPQEERRGRYDDEEEAEGEWGESARRRRRQLWTERDKALSMTATKREALYSSREVSKMDSATSKKRTSHSNSDQSQSSRLQLKTSTFNNDSNEALSSDMRAERRLSLKNKPLTYCLPSQNSKIKRLPGIQSSSTQHDLTQLGPSPSSSKRPATQKTERKHHDADLQDIPTDPTLTPRKPRRMEPSLAGSKESEVQDAKGPVDNKRISSVYAGTTRYRPMERPRLPSFQERLRHHDLYKPKKIAKPQRKSPPASSKTSTSKLKEEKEKGNEDDRADDDWEDVPKTPSDAPRAYLRHGRFVSGASGPRHRAAPRPEREAKKPPVSEYMRRQARKVPRKREASSEQGEKGKKTAGAAAQGEQDYISLG